MPALPRSGQGGRIAQPEPTAAQRFQHANEVIVGEILSSTPGRPDGTTFYLADKFSFSVHVWLKGNDKATDKGKDPRVIDIFELVEPPCYFGAKPEHLLKRSKRRDRTWKVYVQIVDGKRVAYHVEPAERKHSRRDRSPR